MYLSIQFSKLALISIFLSQAQFRVHAQEVFEWRAESKSEAKKLGFKPNKKAVAHELNQSPEVAKDPRSLEQSMKWDATRTAWVERGQKLSLVVDIMEGRRIGMDEVPAGMSNYLALKLEVLKDVSNGRRSVAMVDPEKEAMYSMFQCFLRAVVLITRAGSTLST